MRCFLIRLVLSLLIVAASISLTVSVSGCDSNDGMVDPDPEPDPDPWADTSLVAFVIDYPDQEHVAIAPFSSPETFTIITPDSPGAIYGPLRFSPSKSHLVFLSANGNGPLLIYDVIRDSLFDGPSTGSSWAVAWEPAGNGFFHGHIETMYSSSEAMWSFDLTTMTSSIFSNEVTPLGKLAGDTLLVRAGVSDSSIGSQGLFFYVPGEGLGDRLLNPWLRSYPSNNRMPRAVINPDWNDNRKLYAAEITPQDFTARSYNTVITNQDGSVFTEFTSGSLASLNPRWGPGSLILYEYRSSTSQSIVVVDSENGETRTWALPSDYLDANYLFYPEY